MLINFRPSTVSSTSSVVAFAAGAARLDPARAKAKKINTKDLMTEWYPSYTASGQFIHCREWVDAFSDRLDARAKSFHR